MRGDDNDTRRTSEYRKAVQERVRAYRAAHREELNARQRVYRRWGWLKRVYGLSIADYEALLARQGGVCGICMKSGAEPLCVDHCHATGKVRGLLCRACNTGLGFYKDDERLTAAATAYLRKAALADEPI